MPLSKASSNSSRLRSWLLLEKGTGAIPDKGTQHRVTTARRRRTWLRVSASVRMSSQSTEIIAASLVPMELQENSTVPTVAKTI